MATQTSPMLQVTAVAAASMAVVACSVLLRRLSFGEASSRPVRVAAYEAPLSRHVLYKPSRLGDRIDDTMFPLTPVNEDKEDSGNDEPLAARRPRQRNRDRKVEITSVKQAWRVIQTRGEKYLYTGRSRRELEAAMEFIVAQPSTGVATLATLFAKHPSAAGLLFDHVDVLHSTAQARGDAVLGHLARLLLTIMQQLESDVVDATTMPTQHTTYNLL
ncbi:hypothetical protein ACHHYP_16810 [Achlya hypogyna]|uniref:Uncharacterized protein n=1 Tax=Achlya hypogyna TaxID=1202772 RepID=A0A1V9Y5P0_ACHHY|nr:hypothetical protein ACHHYP_16810 [Achlya hypogyna]